MRLDFNVLWIDDQPNNVASFEERLRIRTRAEGFDLDVTKFSSFAAAEKRLAEDVFLDNIDLVLVDYNLGVGEMGDIAVQAIRHKAPYKDIIFYSAIGTADLKKIILKEGIEGVFCAHRQDLAETLIGVFESLVKKVLDIDHCRGIVMGATSDIDQIVLECLINLAPILASEHSEQAAVYALDKLDERLIRFQQARDALSKTRTVQGLLEAHEVFPAADRLGLLKNILGLHYDNRHSPLRKAIGRYANDIPKRRNELGHVSLVADGGIRSLRGIDSKTITYDELKDLRKQLLDYRVEFDKLLELIRSEKPGVSVGSSP